MRAVLSMAVVALLGSTLPTLGANEAKDPFAVGSLQAGEVRLPGRPEPGRAGLTISERMGESLTGEFVLRTPADRDLKFNVRGTATNKTSGPVILETKKEGVSQLKMRGKLSDNAQNIVFVETSPFGAKGSGAIVLKQKF